MSKNWKIVRETIGNTDVDTVTIKNENDELLAKTDAYPSNCNIEFDYAGLHFLVFPEAKELGEQKVFISFASIKEVVNEK